MNSIPLQKTMFIDIETAAGWEHYHELSPVLQKQWQRKSKYLHKDNENYDETYHQSSAIYAEFGRIVCVCMGYYSDGSLEQFRVKKFVQDSEKELLQQVFQVFDKFFLDNTFVLCGHNIKEFDVPYICRRALIQGVQLPFFFQDLQNRKPWENPLIDTLHQWRFGDFKHYTSLELLAAVLGIETPKDDIDGSQVSQVFWQEKNVDRIATYCSKDVVTTANVVMRMQGKNVLNPHQISFV